MLRNYIRVALRSIRRNRAHSCINIAGLGIGLASFVLILFYIQDELSYDRFHERADRIARVITHYDSGSERATYARTYPAIAPALERDFPEVEAAGRIQRFPGILRSGDVTYSEEHMYFAEPALLQMFSFALAQGEAATALAQPNAAVLTRTTATRYFGNSDPMGQTLLLSDTLSFVVTGIAQDVPENSHLQFDILLSFDTWKSISANRGRNLDELWTAGTFYSYVQLTSPEAVETVQEKMPEFVERHIGDQAGTGSRLELGLQPLADIHLASGLRQDLGTGGSRTNIRIFSVVAVMVLLISCLNFMNLLTALSLRRAREVGVRKSMGAVRGQLVRQFMGETVLMSVLATIVGVVVIIFALPLFNQLSGKALSAGLLSEWPMVGILVLLALSAGILAGVYPSLVLSSFSPNRVLRGTRYSGSDRSASGVRRALVICQFALSTGILIATVVALQQVDFLRSQSLGYDQDQILVIPYDYQPSVTSRLETLKSEFKRESSIQEVTASGDVPGRMSTLMSYHLEGMPEGESAGINALIVDPDFVETYGLHMVTGRDFSSVQASDLGQSFILNEAAVRELGMTAEQVVGRRLEMNERGPVIGVVQDFHFVGLQNELEPLIMTVWPSWFGYLSLRVDTRDLEGTMAHVEDVWKSVVPGKPFESFFLDDDFAEQYRAESRFGRIFSAFAALAILISCLGLFSLAMFVAEWRRREIGVRKTFGATASNIFLLLSTDVTRPVAIAFIIAVPVSWFVMERWLDSFAYRIDMSWGTVLLSAVVVLLISWLTISYQTLQASRTRPVDSLRSD